MNAVRNYEEVLENAWILYEGGAFKNQREILYYFEKPWKYDDEVAEIRKELGY
jgi:hypothetical protein